MRIRCAVVVSLLLLIPVSAFAQWDTDGVKLAAVPGVQSPTGLVADGAGGSYIAWHDNRSSNYNIYLQRLDASGVPQWTIDGVAICVAAGTQDNPALAPDGAGGVIVTWADARSGTQDIYAQRVDGSGAAQWAVNGVALCAAVNSQSGPAIVTDDAGGAIVAWTDARTDAGDIYAQRVDASGAVQWAVDGVVLAVPAGDQIGPMIMSDTAGGAIVTWYDFRTLSHYDIYAQRIDAGGAMQWTPNGAAICTLSQNQTAPRLAPDGSGGAIITWQDFRGGASNDVYAQRINAAGTNQWTANGVVVSTATNHQNYPHIVEDGAGGAYIAWLDYRNANPDIYAQHLGPTGAPWWQSSGIPLCAQPLDQLGVVITGDDAGGAIVAWQDARDGSTDIYAQRVTPNGVAQWTADGVKLCGANSDQVGPLIAWDGFGGAILAWYDLRVGTPDAYAQRVDATYGYWGRPEPIVTSVADIPNDQGGKVAVNWKASGRDIPVPATIDFYSVWRAVDMAAAAIGDGAASITSIDLITADTAPGARTTLAESPYYWELVATQTAYRWPNYSYSAATRADSVMGDSGEQFFMVAAHAVADEHIAFMSSAMSGYSVDNLAPAAPLYLTAQRLGPDVQLTWNRVHVPDLRDYSVYRGTSSGVTPIAPNFLSSADDTVLVDAGAPTTTLYYVVTAYDVHQNQSAPSNEANVSATTNVGDTPALTRLTVLQNRPNPFAGATELEIGLPATSDVAIEVFDVTGGRVRVQSLPRQAAGWRRMGFDGRNDAGQPLPSGVYFFRVTAGSQTVTRKMVIAR